MSRILITVIVLALIALTATALFIFRKPCKTHCLRLWNWLKERYASAKHSITVRARANRIGRTYAKSIRAQY